MGFTRISRIIGKHINRKRIADTAVRSPATGETAVIAVCLQTMEYRKQQTIPTAYTILPL